MYDARDPEWLEQRLRDRIAKRKRLRTALREPGIPIIDASHFSQPVADLAQTFINKFDHDGQIIFGSTLLSASLVGILTQVRHTYDLLRFVNADITRDENIAYRTSYSYVILPLVRTMIDGFYNCTSLLDDPNRVRKFLISGLYRIRESIRTDRERYGTNEMWKVYLARKEETYLMQLRRFCLTEVDIDNKANKWPLLGAYLDQKPDTPHKQMLRRMTHGFWKEYSSISHASFDGILSIFHVLGSASAPHHLRPRIEAAAEREISTHIGRSAGILLCLLTELQGYCRFKDCHIDERLRRLWTAMKPITEVHEFYDYRYKSMIGSG